MGDEHGCRARWRSQGDGQVADTRMRNVEIDHDFVDPFGGSQRNSTLETSGAVGNFGVVAVADCLRRHVRVGRLFVPAFSEPYCCGRINKPETVVVAEMQPTAVPILSSVG